MKEAVCDVEKNSSVVPKMGRARIWVSDDKRPEEIELEGRSTGLQWFLSFYLVFLVESADAHAGAGEGTSCRCDGALEKVVRGVPSQSNRRYGK